MSQLPEGAGLEILHVIVNAGLGSRVLHIAKGQGITGGVIFFGKGTVKSALLKMLALNDIRKEIVWMAATRDRAAAVLETLTRELKLNKPNHGIAYSIPIHGVYGSRLSNAHMPDEGEGAEDTMYQSITIIVDKGKGEAVVEAATQAGSRGATIINARGAGIHETSRLFAMDIEPEKEIVLIISPREQTDAIVNSIRENFHIDKPGSGIVLVQNVTRAYGLFEG